VRARATTILILVSSIVLLMAAGCGYRIVRYQHKGSAIPRIAIVTLVNDSQEAGIELVASDAIRREVLTRGGLREISDPAAADYVLKGSILPVVVQSRSFNLDSLSVERQITLRLSVEVLGREGRRLNFPVSELSASEIYLSSADVEVGRTNRLEALRRLCGLLASRIHDGIDMRLLGVM